MDNQPEAGLSARLSFGLAASFAIEERLATVMHIGIHEPGQSWMTSRVFHYHLAALACFLGLSIWRNWAPFIEPRFWAEEAQIYLHAVQHADWVDVLSFTANSNYQLAANVLAKLSTYAPLVYAPFVTTYLSVAVASILVVVVAQVAIERGVHPLLLLLAVGCLALAPMSYEVFASATNIQWYCGAIVLMLLALRLQSRRWVVFACVCSFLCGLSGLPSVILMPAFIAVGVVRKSRPHLLLAVILLACVAVQAYVLLATGTGGRQFTTSARLLLLPVALHSMLGLVMTPFVVKAIGTVALDWPNFIAIGMLCATLTLVLIRSTDSRNRIDVVLILAAGIGAAVVQTFGALGDPYFLLGGEANGGRYYLVSTSALILTIMLASVHRPRAMACVLGLSLLVQAVASYSPAWRLFNTGPAWAEEVAKCQVDPCQLVVWPGMQVSLSPSAFPH
ncbi:hypothetical protein [Rhizobium sp. RU36D]|uniref:hypothetical protein n=1 Tax=Rhizobium sp. RU36D TaxID=1907415 RepID=UPI0009D811AE|nr:hypothetical protein [Rhizobium sp. RU36D]SMD10828.1 hypothetical protein SAMN05880593_12224 [Rhizobium sp. RU36D]